VTNVHVHNVHAVESRLCRGQYKTAYSLTNTDIPIKKNFVVNIAERKLTTAESLYSIVICGERFVAILPVKQPCSLQPLLNDAIGLLLLMFLLLLLRSDATLL